MPILIIMLVIVLILADYLIRRLLKAMQEKRARAEREAILRHSLNLEFSREAASLKRVEVEHPKARILCVDDEGVILDSFRKILVVDGYSVDSVERGQEALGLVQSRHYDFVFTDLKMPAMSGVDVVKAVKHLRPDIDVVVITGFATVETAVECMKYGALDYVQKPFTEEELLEFTKKILIKRQDRLERQFKPRVNVTSAMFGGGELPGFEIPGGVFISSGHCWSSVNPNGTVAIGLDDFAAKIIGGIDKLELCRTDQSVVKNEPLFTITQRGRSITFRAPLSGRLHQINHGLLRNPRLLQDSPYWNNWVCTIKAENLDHELQDLRIGQGAVEFYYQEIEALRRQLQQISGNGSAPAAAPADNLYRGELERVDDQNWHKLAERFFASGDH